MSWDLNQDELRDKFNALPTTQTPDVGLGHNFVEGAGKMAMKIAAESARAVQMAGAVVPIYQDWMTDKRKTQGIGQESAVKTVTAQERYFKSMADGPLQSAVDFWTPKPFEVGTAGEVVGSLLGMMPLIMAGPAGPSMAVGATMMSQGQNLVDQGAPAGKAAAVGTVQGLGLGLGIMAPILGRTLLERVLVGGAGFNVVQGAVTRGVSGAILEGEKASENFHAFSGKDMFIDALAGSMFGVGAHLVPAQRAQGEAAWKAISEFLGEATPTQKAAAATLLDHLHITTESLPGAPVTPADREVHIQRMAQAINDLANDRPVDVENIVREVSRETPTIDAAHAAVEELNALNPQLNGALRVEVLSDAEMASRPVNEEAGLVGEVMAGHNGSTINLRSGSKLHAVMEEVRHMIDMLLGGNAHSKWLDADADLKQRAVEFLAERRAAGDLAPNARMTDAREIMQALLDQFFRNPQKLEQALPEMYRALMANGADKYAPILDKLQKAQDRPDAMPAYTPDPARAEQDQAIREAIQEHAKTVVAEEGIPQIPDRKSIAQTIEEQLVQAGRPAEEAKAGATLWQAFFDTTASRYGRTGQELFDRYMKGITGQAGEGPMLAQARSPEEWARLDAAYADAVKSGNRRQRQQLVNEAAGIKPMTARLERGDGIHSPSDAESGAPGWDLTGNGIYPEDVYGMNGRRYYGTGDDKMDNAAHSIVMGLEGKPNAPVKVYRAVETDHAGKILPGDWITTVRAYAQEHGRSNMGGNFKIISKTVTAKDIYTSGDSWLEWGYNPQPKSYPRSMAAVADGAEQPPLSKRFGGEQLFQGAVPWYHSELERQIGTAKMGAASPKDWKNYIKGLSNKGVKADEVKWTGLEEWLDLQQGKVTKEQIQQYMKDGGVKVEETTLGAEAPKPYLTNDDGKYQVRLEGGALFGEYSDARDARSAMERAQENAKKSPKFGQWQLPGGENYRELLLTLPTQGKGADLSMIDRINSRLVDKGFDGLTEEQRDVMTRGGNEAMDMLSDIEDRVGIRTKDIQNAMAGGDLDKQFRSSHFDQPNILAHIRFNERTDADGKKVLFIEEIQSDWAQQGKRKGFIEPVDPQRVAAAKAKANAADAERDAAVSLVEKARGDVLFWFEKIGKLQRDPRTAAADLAKAQEEHRAAMATKDRLMRELDDASQKLIEAERELNVATKPSGIPSAPFVGKTEAWVGLALKRMIRFAAENGFDRVAWTNGEQQAARYDLSKQIDSIYVRPLDMEPGTKAGQFPGEKAVVLNMPGGEHIRMAVDANGKVTESRKGDFVGRSLDEVIGKDMAKKIMETETATFSGIDLKVGGEGMKAFYDKIVPNIANDVLKKLGGGRVGETSIETVQPTTNHVPDFNPWSEGTRDAMQGAEDFKSGESPIEAMAHVDVDGQQVRVMVLADASGVHMVAEDGSFDVMAPAEEILKGPGNGMWESASDAVDMINNQWENPKSMLWESMFPIVGDVEKLAPTTKTEATKQPSFDINPSMREKAMETQALFQPAYHGSPHNIGPEGFSATKIGTGEGAQAYGWGLYFAENPEVAVGHHRNLAEDPEITRFSLGPYAVKRGDKWMDYSPKNGTDAESVRATITENLLNNEHALRTAHATGKLREFVLAEIDDTIARYKDEWPQGVAAAEAFRKEMAKPGAIKFELSKTTGGVYQVDIPDEHAANMLLWDKPLSEQPESVRKVLTKALKLKTAKMPEFKAVETDSDNPEWRYSAGGFPAARTPEQAVQNAVQGFNESLAVRGKTGEQIYGQIKEMFEKNDSAWEKIGMTPNDVRNVDEAASRYLASLGIPGLKYLDQGSRTTAQTAADIADYKDAILRDTDHIADLQRHIDENKNNKGLLPRFFEVRREEIANTQKRIEGYQQKIADLESGKDLTHNIVVFDDKIIKITHKDGSPVTQAERDAYLQKEAAPGSGERGALQFDQQGKMAIALLKSADPSTFLHESGHFFLEVTNDLASQPDAPAAMKQDMQTLYSWFGLKDADTWNNMTLDEKRPYHEQFARGFERYFRDGQAPTPVLKGLFQRFRDWLKAVYQSASQLNVEVSPEVRAVMDRMLADRTEAPPEATRSATPPPPRGGVGEPMGEASVPEGTVKAFEPKTSDDPQILEMLRDMATNEAGWAQIGGKWMGKAEKGSGVPNFTTWIPKAEWWNDRPDKKMNDAKFVEAVTKHMTDEKMSPAEKRAVEFLTDIANKRLEAAALYDKAEWNRIAQEVATEGMDPTTKNVVDADAVSIAMQIDEARVERAAITAADDHDFMAEVREIIDGYKPDAATSERGTQADAGVETGKPAGSQAGQEANAPGADRNAGNQGVIAQQALRMVAENPDLPIATGVDAQGNTTYQKASEYLAEAKAMADLRRQDVSLFELAAQCLLGGGR